MIFAIYALSALLLMSLATNCFLVLYWKRTTSDLMNRLMARDLGEYRVTTKQEAPRRRSMTDETEAMIEKMRKEAHGAV